MQATAMERKLGGGQKRKADGLEEKMTWKRTRFDDDDDDDEAYSTSRSPSPSIPFTAPSIAETAQTETSTKRAKNHHCKHDGCGKAFDRPVRLEMHMRSHTNERPYVCEADGCAKTFLRREHLTRHVKDKHKHGDGQAQHTCTYGINKTQDGGKVVCGKSFTTATRLRRHVAGHEAKEETTCTFDACGKIFGKQDTLQRHIKTDHLGEKPYTCSHIEYDENGHPAQCGESFKNSKQLVKHKAREHSEMRYRCDICQPPQDPFADSADLDLATLAEEQLGFPTYADLQLHIKTAHPPTCPHEDCGKQCPSNRALNAHIDLCHPAHPSSQPTQAVEFRCTWAGCERAQPGRGFTKSGNLKVHIQSVHMKAKHFVCGTFDLSESAKVEGWDGRGCGKGFGTKATLEEHVRTQHLGMMAVVRPCRVRKAEKAIKSDAASAVDSPMEGGLPYAPMGAPYAVAGADVGGAKSKALSKLTGHGYADSRPIGCLIVGCQQRFVTEYALGEHLELTHGWHVDDVEEVLAEREVEAGEERVDGHPALWVGGYGDGADVLAEEEEEEAELRQNLTAALAEGREDELVLDPALIGL